MAKINSSYRTRGFGNIPKLCACSKFGPCEKAARMVMHDNWIGVKMHLRTEHAKRLRLQLLYLKKGNEMRRNALKAQP